MAISGSLEPFIIQSLARVHLHPAQTYYYLSICYAPKMSKAETKIFSGRFYWKLLSRSPRSVVRFSWQVRVAPS